MGVNCLFMKKLILFILVLLPSVGFSQKIIAEFPTTTNNVHSPKLSAIADSIYFSYSNGKSTIAYWLSGRKSRSVQAIPNLFTILPFDGELYYYFFDQNSESLRALKIEGEVPKEIDGEIKLEGKILGVFEDDGLNFITLKKEEKLISIISVKRLVIESTKDFSLPNEIAEEFTTFTQTDFINNSSLLTTFLGTKDVKIYKDENIYITFDKRTVAKKNKSWVKVLKLDLATNKSDCRNFDLEFTTQYRSFIYKKSLYAYTQSSEKSDLKVFDLENGNLSSSSTFDKTINGNVYFRSGEDKSVGKAGTFSQLLKTSGPGDPTLAVFLYESNYFIQCGTYYNQTHIGAPVSSGGPLAFLLSMVIGGVLKEAVLEDGNRKYYYIQLGADGKYTINFNPVHPRQQLDDYEIAESSAGKVSYKFKGYLPLGSGLVGVYKKKSESKLTLVRFD